MCVIVICKDKPLTREVFRACFNANPDGVGFAWHDGTKVYYKKGMMKVTEAWESYQGTPLPHVVHFRRQTCGGVVPELTHPFSIERLSPIAITYEGYSSVLFHNGMVSQWETLLMNYSLAVGGVPQGKMSDSRVAALMVSRLGYAAIRFLSGKFVVVEKDDVKMFGDFEKQNGWWFSNMGWKWRVAPSSDSRPTSNYAQRWQETFNVPSALRGSDFPEDGQRYPWEEDGPTQVTPETAAEEALRLQGKIRAKPGEKLFFDKDGAVTIVSDDGSTRDANRYDPTVEGKKQSKYFKHGRPSIIIRKREGGDN